MKYQEKLKAIQIRKNGGSIKEIAKILGVSKGSVSLWVRNIQISKNSKESIFNKGWGVEIVEKRRQSRIKNELEKRNLIIGAAAKDITSISLSELKIIGSILYLAEGGKTIRGIARIANSDPEVIRIMIRFFKEICGVANRRLRAHIHTHSHKNIENAEEYWSKVTGIPRSQFYKTYSKPSISSKSKKDSLPYGTIDVMVCDTKVFLTIMGWIGKIKQLALQNI